MNRKNIFLNVKTYERLTTMYKQTINNHVSKGGKAVDMQYHKYTDKEKIKITPNTRNTLDIQVQ